MKKIITIVILLAALVGGAYLVSQNQETRRGAAIVAVNPVFLPGTKDVKKGDKLTVTLSMYTESLLPKGVDLKIKYDPTILEVTSLTPIYRATGDKGGNKPLFNKGELNSGMPKWESGVISVSGMFAKRPKDELTSGNVQLLKINFNVIGYGKAVVALDESYQNKVYKYDPEDTTTAKTSSTLPTELPLVTDFASNVSYQGVYAVAEPPTSTPTPTPTTVPTAGPTPACTDTDNGKMYNIKGTACAAGICNTDKCVGGKLWEYFCVSKDSNKWVVDATVHTCDGGKTCSSGQCKASN